MPYYRAFITFIAKCMNQIRYAIKLQQWNCSETVINKSWKMAWFNQLYLKSKKIYTAQQIKRFDFFLIFKRLSYLLHDWFNEYSLQNTHRKKHTVNFILILNLLKAIKIKSVKWYKKWYKLDDTIDRQHRNT